MPQWVGAPLGAVSFVALQAPRRHSQTRWHSELVSYVVIEVTATHERHEPPATLLDGTGFSASRGAVPLFRVHGQPLLLHC